MDKSEILDDEIIEGGEIPINENDLLELTIFYRNSTWFVELNLLKKLKVKKKIKK